MIESQGMPKYSCGFTKVKTIILLTFLSAVLLHLLSAIPNIYQSYKSYRMANRVHFLNGISDDLYAVVNNHGFERGRVNVVLNDAGSVEEMDKNRKFIATRRSDGDSALTNALNKLSAVEIQDVSIRIDDIKKIKIKVEELRKQTGAEMLIPKDKRNKNLPKIWFKTMTDYIERVRALQEVISRDINNTDVMISRYTALKNQIMELRNIIAPEMSILSGVILSGKPIGPELKAKVEQLEDETKYCFNAIESLSKEVSSPVIDKELQNLERIYFVNYIPCRDAVFPASFTGGPYPYTQQEFLGRGVMALDQIAKFNSAVVHITSEYATKFRDTQKNNMLFQMLCSFGSFVVMVLIFGYLHYRVIDPIAKLTSIINRLSAKDLGIEIPFINTTNEIGELAKSINIFKKMALQIEEDMKVIKKFADEQDVILSNAETGIIYVQNSKIVWKNRAFNEIFYFDPEYLLQQGIERLFSSLAECELILKECSPILASNKTYSKEFKMRRSDDTLFYARLTCKAIDSLSPEAGSIWIISDETQRHLLQDKLQKNHDMLACQKEELEIALARVKQMEGIIPICSYCKKIRDDKSSWHQLEQYITEHSEAHFSHGICPDCYEAQMELVRLRKAPETRLDK